MSLFAKVATAVRLTLRADWTVVRNRLLTNFGRARLRLHGGSLFRHHSLGFPAVCHPDWPDSVDQFTEMAGDRWEIGLMCAWLKADDLIVDAGTNLGLYAFALATAASGPQGRVLAIDADAYAVDKLTAAAQRFGLSGLVPVHAAVGEREGEVTFYTRTDRVATSEQSLRPPPGAAGEAMTGITVPLATLPGLCARLAPGRTPDIVKLDIEGAETSALTAVPEAWFAADGPFWLIEINPEALARFGTTPAEAVGRFRPEAFECWILPKHPRQPGGSTDLRPMRPGETFADSIYYNFIALPRGSARAARRAALPGLPAPSPVAAGPSSR